MFNNVGKKLQALGKILFWLLLVVFLVFGILVYRSGLKPMGIFFMVICPFLSWLSCAVVIAIGISAESAERAKTINLDQINLFKEADPSQKECQSNLSQLAKEAEDQALRSTGWCCPNCQTNNANSDMFCKNCGKYR